jgi:hypothetical protein
MKQDIEQRGDAELLEPFARRGAYSLERVDRQ